MTAAPVGFDDAVLGAGLPTEVEPVLLSAGQHRSSDPALAMALLLRAQALAPDHPAVLIAFYRHHFYGHRLRAARDALRTLRALDPDDRVGGALLEAVRVRALVGNVTADGDNGAFDEACAPAFGAAAWAHASGRPATA